MSERFPDQKPPAASTIQPAEPPEEEQRRAVDVQTDGTGAAPVVPKPKPPQKKAEKKPEPAKPEPVVEPKQVQVDFNA
jgi:hypothetical protein